jgi:hypothetical protein
MTRATRPYADSSRIDTRLWISALWVAVLFVFAYVDLFSLYRPDVRADLEADTIAGFDVDQTFLFLTTLYVVVPSLMVYLTLVLRPAVNRVANIAVAAAYALTIVGSAVGEWGYYVLGSAVEVLLVAIVIHHAWTWPTAGVRDGVGDDSGP